MKLSQLSTEQTANVLCKAIPYIEAIISDKELMELIAKKVVVTNDTSKIGLYTAFVERITKIIPLLLKNKREDLFGLVAVMNDKTVEEVKEQNIIKTMVEIREMFKDKELLDFFKSCTGTEESE